MHLFSLEGLEDLSDVAKHPGAKRIWGLKGYL